MTGHRVKRRKRFFVGCEGESEQGYARLIQRFAEEELSVHIDAKLLNRAGDPLALTKRAVAEIAHAEQLPGSKYSHRFLLFDTDRLGLSQERGKRLAKLVLENNLVLVRQGICFEAVLPRHFEGHETAHPMTSADALRQLKKIWPDYQKGASAIELANE